MSGRVLVANLDCEVAYARADAAERRARGEGAPSAGAPCFAVRPAVLARVAALGTLMRAWAEEDDALWTPAPVDAGRVPPVPGLPDVRLVTGVQPDEPALRWADETDAARRANDRRFSQALADRLGVALPGSGVVASLDELAARITGERWVLKAPFGSAGRRRVLGRGGKLDGPTRVHAGRLLETFGEAVFEPWSERTADFGVVDGRAHRLVTDASGVFRAIQLPCDVPVDTSIAAAVGEALRRTLYEGPFGIDGYVHTGGVRPLCEINARRTFGGVARRLLERVGAALERAPGGEMRLGTGAELAAAVDEGAVPLLRPGADDPTAAWLRFATDC